MPRWLNEGLAQVFEHGQLDGDYLRIDSPSPELLRGLRIDLHRGPLPLAEVVRATSRQFHGQRDEQMAQRLYYYSWGLAYFLVFEKGHSVDELLQQLRQASKPIAGLREVTKQDLDELSTEFREFALSK